MSKPDLVWDSSEYSDPDEEMWAFEDLTCELTDHMKKMNPDGLWYATVENFGWTNASGEARFEAHNGLQLLQAVLPNTRCTYKVWLHKKEIKIDNAHHDKPTGGELYSILPRKRERVWRRRSS